MVFRARTTKAQPLTLDCLLEMRKHLKEQLNALRADGVTQTALLQEPYERCDTAIRQATVEKRISNIQSAISRF